MRTLVARALLVIAAAGACHAQDWRPSWPAVQRQPIARSTEAIDLLQRRAPVFVENDGQWNRRARFLMSTAGLDLWVTDRGFVYDVRRETSTHRDPPTRPGLDRHMPKRQVGHVVAMSFVGAVGGRAIGENVQRGVSNYLIGKDTSLWATNVRHFSGTRIVGIYPGIDAVASVENGRPRYDLIVAPHADPSSVRMKYDGAQAVRVTSRNELAIATSVGDLVQRELLAYQMIDGRRVRVDCRFALASDATVRFALGSYDHTSELVIDPILYSTLLGGTNVDDGYGMAVDNVGAIYLCGEMGPTAFPTTVGAYDVTTTNSDAFVSKINPALSGSAQLVYSTYIGGSAIDYATDLAIDATGRVYIEGTTSSTDYPTTSGAFATSKSVQEDVFVTRLDPAAIGAAQLSYSTYLGGTGLDQGTGITVLPGGNIYVVGATNSSNFPTKVGAFDATYGGNVDAFVTGLNPAATGAAQLVFGIYLGGAGSDYAVDVKGDAAGSIVVAGDAGSSTFPTLGAFDATFNGSDDGFVVRLNPAATGAAQLTYGTFIGGSSSDGTSALAIAPSGRIAVVGATWSTDYPVTAGAFDATFNGQVDMFAAMIDPAVAGAGGLVFATYLGGAFYDIAHDVAVDAAGGMFVAGQAYSPTFPVTLDADDATFSAFEGTVSKLDPGATGSAQLVHSTLLGSGSVKPLSIAWAGSGHVYVAGETYGQIPLSPGAYDVTPNGQLDVFATEMLIGRLSLQSFNRGSYCRGAVQTITWSSSAIANMRIDLSSDGGVTWPTVIVSSTPAATGSFAWTIPTSLAPGTNYRIRVADAGDPGLVDVSDTSFTIADCRPPCVSVAGAARAECIGDTAAMPVYRVCVPIRNICRLPGTLRVSSGAGSSFVVTSIAPAALAPSSVTTVCVTFMDVPPLESQICLYFTVVYEGGRCDTCSGIGDSVCVQLPICPCLTLVEPHLTCVGPNQAGATSYAFVSQVTAGAAGIVQIIPASGSLSGAAPQPVAAGGTVLAAGTWTPSGTDTTACFTVRLTNATGAVVCSRTVCIPVPPCAPACACPFRFAMLERPRVSASGNGVIAVYAPLTTGSLTKLVATVVSASIQQSCGGPITTPSPSTVITGGAFAPFVVSGLNTAEATWTNLSCPTVGTTTLPVYVRVLPAPARQCRQRVRVCIRYTAIDCECSSCDTTICYQIDRRWSPWTPVDRGSRGERLAEKEDPGLEGAPDATPFAAIVMSSERDGTLTITNPRGDSTTDEATIRALTLATPPGIDLVAMSPSGGLGWSEALPTDSGFTSAGTLTPGGSIQFALSYRHAPGVTSWVNTLRIAYTSASFPGDEILSAEMEVPARTPQGRGGDTIMRDVRLASQRKDVRTFALTFSNANIAGDSIETVIVRSTGAARIIASGPGEDSMQVALSSYRSAITGAGLLIDAPSADAIVSRVTPGSQSGPIYLTIAGAENDRAVLEYVTLARDGDTVSRGTISVGSPLGLSSIGDRDNRTVTTVALAAPEPNPADAETRIRFVLAHHEAMVRLVLSDARGAEIERIVDGEMLEAGEHVVTVQTGALPAGTYFCTLRTETESQTRTLTVVR